MGKIKSINQKDFEKYGKVIEFPKDFNEAFYVVESESQHPWRIAVFRYKNKSVRVLENHPESKESFEPVKGITFLIVAENSSPQEYETFILDKPVCLNKGVWHQVLSLTDEAEVKITENLEVRSEFYEFDSDIELMAVQSNH